MKRPGYLPGLFSAILLSTMTDESLGDFELGKRSPVNRPINSEPAEEEQPKILTPQNRKVPLLVVTISDGMIPGL